MRLRIVALIVLSWMNIHLGTNAPQTQTQYPEGELWRVCKERIQRDKTIVVLLLKYMFQLFKYTISIPNFTVEYDWTGVDQQNADNLIKTGTTFPSAKLKIVKDNRPFLQTDTQEILIQRALEICPNLLASDLDLCSVHEAIQKINTVEFLSKYEERKLFYLLSLAKFCTDNPGGLTDLLQKQDLNNWIQNQIWLHSLDILGTDNQNLRTWLAGQTTPREQTFTQYQNTWTQAHSQYSSTLSQISKSALNSIVDEANKLFQAFDAVIQKASSQNKQMLSQIIDPYLKLSETFDKVNLYKFDYSKTDTLEGFTFYLQKTQLFLAQTTLKEDVLNQSVFYILHFPLTIEMLNQLAKPSPRPTSGSAKWEERQYQYIPFKIMHQIGLGTANKRNFGDYYANIFFKVNNVTPTRIGSQFWYECIMKAIHMANAGSPIFANVVHLTNLKAILGIQDQKPK